jgi:hypothetical protein
VNVHHIRGALTSTLIATSMAAAPTGASAFALFDSYVEAYMTLLEATPDDATLAQSEDLSLSFRTVNEPFEDTSFVLGDAYAEADGDASVSFVGLAPAMLSFAAESSVLGEALGPDGVAQAESLDVVEMELSNSGATPYTLSFGGMYTMAGSAWVGTTDKETAYADASVFVYDVTADAYLVDHFADAVTVGTTRDEFSMFDEPLGFSLVLAPDAAVTLAFGTEAYGDAVSAVPLPAAFPLLLAGVAGLMAIGRRRGAV